MHGEAYMRTHVVLDLQLSGKGFSGPAKGFYTAWQTHEKEGNVAGPLYMQPDRVVDLRVELVDETL